MDLAIIIEKACRHYFKERGSLKKYERLSNGEVNITCKVWWDQELLIVRFYTRDSSCAHIEKQIYHMIQAHIPVASLLFISPTLQPYPFAIFRFCPKPHIYELSPSTARSLSYALGTTLAKIHAIRFPCAGLFAVNMSIDTVFENGSRPYFEYCLKHFTPESLAWKRVGATKALQVLHFIQSHRDFFPKIENGGCLVHSDFKPVNLLWNEVGGLTVLDWEFAHSGHALMDFGILLRHFKDFPCDIASLEKGYRDNKGELTKNWVQSARITDFVNMIQLLNRPLDRPKLFQNLINSMDLTISAFSYFSK